MRYEDLKILEELRQKNSITEEEFQREKEKILNSENYSSSSATPLWGMDEKSYLLLMHLSQFITFFILPLIMWITNKEYSKKVDQTGKNLLNFAISYTIYIIISSFLVILIIGGVLLFILGIMITIFIILGAIKASNGEVWKYPLTIDFIK